MKRNSSERGSAMVESLFVMLLLCLILFGLLQIFLISAGQMISDYAAFRSARSAAVGFNSYFVNREGRVKAIGASGNMVEPENSSFFTSKTHQFAYETVAVEEFLDGRRWLNYEFWDGSSSMHTNYKCPYYGQTRGSSSCPNCPASRQGTNLEIHERSAGREAEAELRFRNYPLNMPLADFLFGSDSFDLNSLSAKTADYASDYLED